MKVHDLYQVPFFYFYNKGQDCIVCSWNFKKILQKSTLNTNEDLRGRGRYLEN